MSIFVYFNYMLSVSKKKGVICDLKCEFNTNFTAFFAANKSKVFNYGTNVNLTCSDKTWNEILYVIWNIYFRDHSCKITFSSSGEAGENSCRDGMSLQNTSSAQSYLYIPNFSTDDVGMYKCESVYRGGRENYNINVSITVAPKISAWLEYDGSKTVAVCRAEQGNPAANISWSPAENKSVMSINPSDGFFNVESRLSEEEFPENLTCIISHQLWNQDKTLVPDRSKMKKVFFLQSFPLKTTIPSAPPFT
uniref:Ig-like domain-containing protein n=1 Tax=Oryzias sinensis TaxID=183150 RepID=A0A8C7XSN9_9TELE